MRIRVTLNWQKMDQNLRKLKFISQLLLLLILAVTPLTH